MKADYSHFTRKKKLFRPFVSTEILACFPLPAARLKGLALGLHECLPSLFSAQSLLNEKGRWPDQFVEIPGRDPLGQHVLEGEILHLAGTIELEQEGEEEENLIEKKDGQESPNELHRFHYSIHSQFKCFPEPTDIAFSIDTQISPARIQNLSLEDIFKNSSLDLRELRFGLLEFHIRKSFFGPTPSPSDQLLIDASSGEFRILLSSEKLPIAKTFPLYRSGYGEKTILFLKHFFDFDFLDEAKRSI